MAQVIGYIRELIEAENLQPGMKLPPERTLAAALKVGRPVVREAIKALSMLEILESRRGDGTYVRSLSALNGGWPAHFAQADSNFNIIELMEIRKIIEPRAAALAAERATPRQVRDIHQKLVAQETDPAAPRVLVMLDLGFHEAILRASGNSLLFELMQPLTGLLLICREFASKGTQDSAKVIQQHRGIFECIQQGDANGAEALMREHLNLTAVHLLSQHR